MQIAIIINVNVNEKRYMNELKNGDVAIRQ